MHLNEIFILSKHNHSWIKTWNLETIKVNLHNNCFITLHASTIIILYLLDSVLRWTSLSALTFPLTSHYSTPHGPIAWMSAFGLGENTSADKDEESITSNRSTEWSSFYAHMALWYWSNVKQEGLNPTWYLSRNFHFFLCNHKNFNLYNYSISDTKS